MPARYSEEGPESHRMEGCESTNHTHCYGELWQCVNCGKTACYAEGSDHDHELCDDCWAMKYPLSQLDNDVPF